MRSRGIGRVVDQPDIQAIDAKFKSFIARVTRQQYVPQKRFVRDFLFGAIRRKSIVMAEAARGLEESIPLIQTEKRLSRNMCSPRLRNDDLLNCYLRLVSPLLKSEKVRPSTIAVDTTDIAKPYAKKMPFLGYVRDGSETGTRDPSSGQILPVIKPGYNVITVEAANDDGRRMPLYAKVWGKHSPGHIDERTELVRAIKAVKPHVPRESIWAFDRGFDGEANFRVLRKHRLKFVVRCRRGTRTWLLVGGERTKIEDALAMVDVSVPFRVRKFKNSRSSVWSTELGWLSDVRVPGQGRGLFNGRRRASDQMSLVVVRSKNSPTNKPMLLFTNVPVLSSEDAIDVANAYFERWASEENHRWCKVQMGMESVRALTWTSIERTVLLTMLAYGFISWLLWSALEWTKRIAKAAKAFGSVPRYPFYRLHEGLRELATAGMWTNR